MSSEPGVAHLGGKSDRPLGLREAATMCGCSETTIQRLIEIGLLPADGPRVADINGIRLILSFESAGISLDAFAVAARSGFLSLEFRRRLLADPIPLSKTTYREACRDLGLEESIATRLLVAAGLPEPEPDRVVREDDLLLLRLLADALAVGVTEESGVRVLRVFGRTVRLQAEAMRDLFRHDVEAATENQGRSPAAVMEVAAQRRLPLQRIGFELLELLSRRNLEDVVFENVTMRIQDAMAMAGLALERTESDPAIAFIDISGFSRMTREVGDDEAARRVARFEEIAQESVGRRRGRIVKSLGDGILTLFETPMDASQAGVDLMHRLGAEGLPTAHIGLTVGPVVRRDGDVFGNSVNLAARLAGFANPSETVTPRSSVPDGEVAGHQWIDGGKVTPKDFAPIHIMRLRPLADSADDNQHPTNPD